MWGIEGQVLGVKDTQPVRIVFLPGTLGRVRGGAWEIGRARLTAEHAEYVERRASGRGSAQVV